MDCLVDLIEEISTSLVEGSYAIKKFLNLKNLTLFTIQYYYPNYHTMVFKILISVVSNHTFAKEIKIILLQKKAKKKKAKAFCKWCYFY